MKQKKILFYSNVPTPYQIDFLSELSIKNDVQAFFLWEKVENLSWNSSGEKFVRVFKYGATQREKREVLEAIKDFSPDFIIIGGYRLPLVLRILKYCRKNRVRSSFWLEKPLPSKFIKGFFKKIYWIFFLPRVDVVFGIGKEAVICYKKYCKLIFNLPYSINIDKYQFQKINNKTNPIHFIFVGQLIKRKGIVELLKAFANIPNHLAVLSIFGEGELLQLVNDYSMKYSNIEYHGFLQPEKLTEVYSKNDVFILPSKHDGWAVVVCEAMACGLPIIGSQKTGAINEFIIDGENGFICAATEESITNSILKYVNSPELIQAHGKMNRHSIERSLASSVNAASFVNKFISNVEDE
ncbi:MAG: hypothetical protein COW00_00855 [Bdellovibrio sp. CG12_big_fil_rev_8_21_14_0_65_39_13]|nr:MAG: hypothetical protein COW78_20445 [Bdellovibrio sp. CG22_combo_CG10-13_8_21_14_all_39_27]PIQ62804.1 MAG: hypothetical protein COW00_00855 [Bdellovibrio sp. CG12_big_fil_rev_8_21_14_0_65_39_13]PIR32538.1 MAG: hypothetical protein COV37_19560 [Bdellovibrio sp. CG11_big_fil_rev_8_21_14_0_20_39_38]